MQQQLVTLQCIQPSARHANSQARWLQAMLASSAPPKTQHAAPAARCEGNTSGRELAATTATRVSATHTSLCGLHQCRVASSQLTAEAAPCTGESPHPHPVGAPPTPPSLRGSPPQLGGSAPAPARSLWAHGAHRMARMRLSAALAPSRILLDSSTRGVSSRLVLSAWLPILYRSHTKCRMPPR